MARIVINIPDATYDFCNKYGYGNKIISQAVKNGILLPKGHGRLIDADALRDTYARAGLVGYDEEIQAIDDSPTVIEADEEIGETAIEKILRRARNGDEIAKEIRTGIIEGLRIIEGLNGSSL